MRRGLLVLFLAALTGAASPQNTNDARPVSFDPKPWLEDFHQVLSEMSSHYANLESRALGFSWTPNCGENE